MSVIKHAIISAAGLGSRLELNCPKCLVEVGGRKIIDYQLDLIKDVEDVRIVVGFMEHKVIKHVLSKRKDVVFVRNSDFRSTTNSYSLSLATNDLDEPFLSIDGDVIIKPSSFERFLSECDGSRSIIGVTPAKTTEAVFTDVDSDGMLNSFSFTEHRSLEWSGIAYLKGIKIEKSSGFVFKEIEKYLPLQSALIECHEIDTPEDLDNATKIIREYGL